MAENEYERDEQMLEARRLKRLELKRRRTIRKRIIYGVAFLVLVLVIVLIVKSCGAEEDSPPTEDDTAQTNDQQDETHEDATPPPEPTKATLSAVGDIMIYDNQLADAAQTEGTYNFLSSLAPVSTLLTASDLTVGNFEATFSGAPYAGYPTFSAPESLATTLAGLGFDILQTANTYSIQNGLAGLTSTINTIRGEGMSSLGTYLSQEDKQTNQVVVKEVNDIRIAFVGFTKGVNNLTLPAGAEYAVDLLYTDYYTNYSTINTSVIQTALSAAKATEPDIIVAMVHWGAEYDATASSSQQDLANVLIQGGADVILGSHPHVVGPMERRTVTVEEEEKEVFIAYSLGNFFSGMEKENQPGLKESLVLNLEFSKDQESGETTISDINYVPVYFFDHGEAAVNRFELRNVHDVLADDPDESTKALMEKVLADLTTSTGSDFDRGY